MATKYKRTISVVLVLANIISNTNCQNIEDNHPKTIVTNLPGEHLLRGSSDDRHGEEIPPLEAVRSQTAFNANQHELPFNNAGTNTQTQERPTVFVNTEDAKSVQVTDSDVVVDPATGQTMIKHINPYHEANAETDYLMRPTDLTLKNLQGFYVAGDTSSQTTVTEESPDINPIPLSLRPNDSKTEDVPPKTDAPLATNLNYSDLTNIPSSTTVQYDITLPAENILKIPEDSQLDEVKNAALVNESNAKTTAESPELGADTTEVATTMNEDVAAVYDVTDRQTEEEDAVYKLGENTTKTEGDESNNNVESNTAAFLLRSEQLTTNEAGIPTTQAPDEADLLGGVGARLGLDDDSLLGPAVHQRTPKLDKAAPPNALDKRTFEALHRTKVKLSKRDTLRSWLQDPWLRSPLGVLVPLRARSIGRALAVWREVASPEGLNLTDVLVIGYDENGIGWLSKNNLQSSDGVKSVANALQKLLLKYQSVTADKRDKGDAALHACAWAAKLVPYDSALFIVTDSAPSDAQRLPAALRAIIDKRLKLYTIWTDPLYPSAASEMAVLELMKASKYTEGEFLDYHPAVAQTANDDGQMASEPTAWSHNVYRTANVDQRARTAKLDGGVRDKYETLLVRRINGGGPSALGIPVEEGAMALRVRIDGRIERAALYPPTGPQIDLFNATSVTGFAPGSTLDSTAPLEATLVFPAQQDPDARYGAMPGSEAADEASQRKTVGLWRLSVRCNGCEYRVLVTALAPIGLDASMDEEDMLRLRARGPIASVRETTLIDEYGTELAKLPFSHQPSANEDGLEPSLGDGIGMPTLAADVPLPPVRRSSKVYVKVVGRDIYGEAFTRVSGPLFKSQDVRTSRSAAISFPDDRSEALQSTFSFPGERTAPLATARNQEQNQRLFFGNNDTNTILPSPTSTSQISSQSGTLLTAVQIGLSTRLYGAPGDNMQLHFEVTNYRDRNINFRFEASGNLRFLRGIRPQTQWINAGQTANVIVDVGITTSAQIGARDLITFTATGMEQVSISAYVYVVSSEQQVRDTWMPNVRHTFQGDCMMKQGDDCSRHTWAATVYARDNDGGLLRLSSSPVGLRYESSFIAGTREEVTATYRATCCAPRLLVNAVDTSGNANTYTIDIAYYIPDAAIAAIVLGVLLLIALIAVIAFLVYLCVRRRKESRQLPSYATPRRET